MKKQIFIFTTVLFFNLSGFTQDTPQPVSAPVIVSNFYFTPLPPGDTSFKHFTVDSVINYYVDKGVRPNAMIKNFRILRHVWGSDSYKTIFIYEIDKMENLDKAGEKSDELINASLKDKKDRDKFWRLWGRLFDRHDDTIMADFVKPKM